MSGKKAVHISSLLAALTLLVVAAQEAGSFSNRPVPRPSSDPDVVSLQHEIRQMEHFKLSDPRQLVLLGPDCVKKARRLRQPELEMVAQRYLGSGLMVQERYRPALVSLLAARAIAKTRNNHEYLYILNNNIAWIYGRMNNFEMAGSTADLALNALHALGKTSLQVSTLRATIYGYQNNFSAAERLFSSTIAEALNVGNKGAAALAWKLLGETYFHAGRISNADLAETEAYRLTKTFNLPGEEIILCDLGSVRIRQGNLAAATSLLDRAVVLLKGADSDVPVWWFYKERGKLRSLKSDTPGAMADFRYALDLARHLDIIPTDDDRVAFESGLQELYSLFIDAGNSWILAHPDSDLEAEMFSAAEENRAASLRALVPQPNDWRTQLPPEHAELLARLQDAEHELLTQESSQLQKTVNTLRTGLNELEVKAGADRESLHSSSLAAVRGALKPDSVLLSFHLGDRQSWLWAITNDQAQLYPLPPRAQITARFPDFKRSIQADDRAGPSLGAEIYQTLFGQLSPSFAGKHSWILELDQDLFELPFGALMNADRFLVEQHALLLTPSAHLPKIGNQAGSFDGPMAAFGDPVYNAADERWQGRRHFAFLQPKLSLQTTSLARLAGSSVEAESAVRTWKSGRVFEGIHATRSNLLTALASNPAVLHLATHVIRSPRYRSGMIVLSMDGNGKFEYLDVRDIVLLPVTARLVVMSGCSSGDAAVLPASGLMGLTRAWLGAGAENVLATRWPAIDDTDPFFDTFYRSLKCNPGNGPAEALRRAQVAMIRSGTFRNAPRYWASYFLIGRM